MAAPLSGCLKEKGPHEAALFQSSLRFLRTSRYMRYVTPSAAIAAIISIASDIRDRSGKLHAPQRKAGNLFHPFPIQHGRPLGLVMLELDVLFRRLASPDHCTDNLVVFFFAFSTICPEYASNAKPMNTKTSVQDIITKKRPTVSRGRIC